MIKFLFVDDSSFMRNIEKVEVQKAFSDAQCFEAKNGIEAIEIYKKINPNIVLMDITMPEMQGTDAVKHIKSFDPDCKIIMVSAMGQAVMVTEALQAGAKDFIVKPFDKIRLIEVIKKLL